MNFLPWKQKKPLRQIYPQSLRSRFCGVKATSCRTAKSCRCLWQTAFFEELDTAQHTDREKDGYEGGWYDKDRVPH